MTRPFHRRHSPHLTPSHQHQFHTLKDYTGYIFVEAWGSLYLCFSSTSIVPDASLFWLSSTSTSTSSSMAVKFVGGMWFDARLIHASITASLRGGLSMQTPQLSDHPDQWATFLPGEQGLHFDINPAVLAPHKLSFHLVTYLLMQSRHQV